MAVDGWTDLVDAARAGDQRAAERLITHCLPLLYRIVGEALGDHPDVDDVVQETVLRAHRDLSALRTPEGFRPWLVAIAMHQISNRQQAWRRQRSRVTSLDQAVRVADPGAEFADATLLRLSLSDQRRQIAEAARWLDPGDRDLLPLWWREVAGDLSRAELVAVLGVGSGHARVRIQRMRRQLELTRLLVAALGATPRCPGLAAIAHGWDGTPGPRWRKRFGRHVRGCDRCGAARSGFVPLDRLLAGAAAVSGPAGAATEVLAGGAGWLGQLAGAKIAAALLVGATVSSGIYLNLPSEQPRAADAAEPAPPPAARPGPASRPGPTARPSPAPRPSAAARPSPADPLPPGRFVIRPVAGAGTVVALDGARLVEAAGPPGLTVTVTPGLADRNCVSLRAADGRYVRHSSFRLRLDPDDGQVLFQMDATFCPAPGATPGSVRLASYNFPVRFVHATGDGPLGLDPEETGAAYAGETSYRFTGS
ncbi:sigma-70 family RNA polymerase sigma factor [Actinoplanes sp. NPDC089786]|uniref:sigma-70 family RNA polymerase sigma factor n=1 Tax=Actinoplanes sp. NPDC089786 TaxID=3155185 RepID=UPI003424E50A